MNFIEEKELIDQANKFDLVIEACGCSDVVKSGIRLLKPGGTYIFVGMVHPQSSFNVTGEQIIRKCLTIKGVHNYDRIDLDNAVKFLSRNINKYPFQSLVSPQLFTLNQLPQAMEIAKTKTYPRVCIIPN
jgi:threonine dehydrogenase-like Zn-dependent dehydrogenase